MKTLGIILAGGLARRMGGRDKAGIVLGGQTLLSRAEAQLAPQVDALAVNANVPVETTLQIVPDLDDSRAGPLAGVLAGLRHAEEQGASHIVTVAVDTPFFPTDLVSRLRDAAVAEEVPLACAASDGRAHPVFGLWPVALADDLADAMANGMRKVDRWTGQHGCAVVDFATDAGDPFFNVNTPEDLALAEGMV